MTRIQEIDMDVYAEPIAVHAARHPQHPVDLEAMNLADAANYRAAQARTAHPHYKRHGHIDTVTGAFTPYTADELADMKAARRESLAIRGLVGIILVCAAIAVALFIGMREGWLS